LATLTETFLKQNVHADIFQEFPFLLAEIVPPKILNEKQFSEFENLYLQLMKEYGSTSPYRNKLIGHLIVLILLKIKEYFWKDYDPISEGTRSSQIVKISSGSWRVTTETSAGVLSKERFVYRSMQKS
jgi:hypothetical protein